MPELDGRFSALDLLEPTDLTEEIGRRATLPEPAPLPERPRRRIVAGLVAAAIFAAVAVFAWSALRPIERRTPVGPSPEASPSVAQTAVSDEDPWRGLPEGATELPPPPRIRGGEVRVWTGSQLVVWGGNASRTGDPPHANDGSVFDARSRSWSKLPLSPLTPRSWPGAAWTGSEIVIWGGAEGSWPGERPLGDGAAYDPQTETWRPLSPAPIPANAPLVSAWTGSEVVFWGSVDSDGGTSGAAYDPASDTWRTIPDPEVPITDSVTSAWTGAELIVVGGNGRKWYANAAAYDPATDTWRTIPNGELDGNAVAIAAVGGRVIGADYNKHAAAFDGADWTPLPDLPTDTCEGGVALFSVSPSAAVAELCGDVVAMREGDPRWIALTDDIVARGGLAFGYAAAGEVALMTTYVDGDALEEGRAALVAFRMAMDDVALSHADATDLVTAFAALRSHYPFDSDIPARAEAQMRTMLSPEGSTAWEDPGMPALWAYYTDFEVVSVDRVGDGSFAAEIRLDGYGTPDAAERMTVAPGTDLDGVERDLVIVDARPA